MKHLALLENVIVPALILAAGVVVVQAHAIGYWQATMGLAVGLVASLGAELTGLYLVYQPGRLARATGLVLVAVMVLVPAWVILGPEYQAWHGAREAKAQAIKEHAEQQAEASAKLPPLEQDIAAAERSLREDEAKSAVRAGWLDELRRQRETLERLRTERRDLRAVLDEPAPDPAGYDWLGALPKVLPVLALLIAFQMVNAYAVLRISGHRHWGGSATGSEGSSGSGPGQPREALPEPPTEPVQAIGSDATPAAPAEPNRPADSAVQGAARAEPPPAPELVQPDAQHVLSPCTEPVQDHPEPLAGNDLLVRRLQLTLKDRIQAAGSRNAFCRTHNLNPRDVTWLGQHFARRKEGKPTISEAKLTAMAELFLPTEQPDAGQA